MDSAWPAAEVADQCPLKSTSMLFEALWDGVPCPIAFSGQHWSELSKNVSADCRSYDLSGKDLLNSDQHPKHDGGASGTAAGASPPPAPCLAISPLTCPERLARCFSLPRANSRKMSLTASGHRAPSRVQKTIGTCYSRASMALEMRGQRETSAKLLRSSIPALPASIHHACTVKGWHAPGCRGTDVLARACRRSSCKAAAVLGSAGIPPCSSSSCWTKATRPWSQA